MPAKAAVASEHIRYAGFDRLILAIPMDAAGADLDDRAPRRIPEILGVTRGDIEAN